MFACFPPGMLPLAELSRPSRRQASDTRVRRGIKLSRTDRRLLLREFPPGVDRHPQARAPQSPSVRNRNGKRTPRADILDFFYVKLYFGPVGRGRMHAAELRCEGRRRGHEPCFRPRAEEGHGAERLGSIQPQFALPSLLRRVVSICRIGAVDVACPGRTTLSSGAWGCAGDQGRLCPVERSLAATKPVSSLNVSPTAPSRLSAFSSSTNLALQPAGAVSALTTISARSQSSSKAMRSRTMLKDSPSGNAATQPSRSQRASGSRAVEGSRPSPSAVSHCSAAKALNRLPTTCKRPSAS